MTHAHSQPLCAMCNEGGTLRCTSCSSMHYCSKKCQKYDWPVHKLVCKNYKAFLATNPGPGHRSVIYFPVDEPLPRFIWVRFDEDQERPTTEQLALSGINVEELDIEKVREVGHSGVLCRHISPHHIATCSTHKLGCNSFCAARNGDKSCTTGQPNHSFREIDNELAEHFRGPVLAWAVRCPDETETASDLNMGTMDFRYLIDDLRGSYNVFLYLSEKHNGQKRPVVAVRLNCEGDQKNAHRSSYESVMEYTSTITKASEIPTPVADKIGLPLIVRKVPPAILWRDRSLGSRMTNYSAPILNPPHQAANTGSLIFVRKDGKPLSPTHLLILCHYTADRLVDPNHPKNACITPSILRLDRLDGISKKDFQEYYYSHWSKHPRTHFVPSPFDISDDCKEFCNDINVG